MKSRQTKNIHVQLVAVAVVFTMIVVGPLQYAFALNYPDYRTDYELHNIELYGQRSYVKVITPTLSDDNPQWWAKSYVVEMNIVSKSDAGAVGAGYAYYKDLNGNTKSEAIKYYWDKINGNQGYEFSTKPSSTSYRTSAAYDSYDSGNDCYKWYRQITSSDVNTKCIQNFSWAYPRVWSISSTSSNQFSSASNEYSTTQYQDTIGGSAKDWSQFPGSGQMYCWGDSPFNQKTSDSGDTWDVIPPGTNGDCNNSLVTKSLALPG